MKFISWNVNGLRACLKKALRTCSTRWTRTSSAFRRPKCSPDRRILRPRAIPSTSTAPTKGLLRHGHLGQGTPAQSVRYGLDEDIHNHEGRAITLEYPDFYLVNLYVPNSQNELARIDYRMQWEDDLRRYLQKLDAEKPVILCGDLNVAHEDIDLKNPGPNRGAAGFLTRSAASWASCWPRALRIPSATCTPTPPACTAGGVCASAPVSGTQAGGSTISSSAAAWPIRSRKQRF